MAQVLAAAWVGIMVGWIGFGWVLAEAPSENGIARSGVRMAALQGEAAVNLRG